ncbi:hypothetical protein ACLB2K_060783 [Fragaria x ananassa]
MVEKYGESSENHFVNVEEGKPSSKTSQEPSDGFLSVIAEVLGTYFLIFAGCGSVIVNLSTDKLVSFPGISITWGLMVMVMVYSVGHISGAHFNPAVTLAFAITHRFPWKEVPAYIIALVLGSTLESGTL